MSTLKTFRVNGELAYDDIDDNWDNLNNDKIERVVSVNDASTGLSITQTGSGKKLTVNTDKFVVDANNKVGVGTATPAVALDVVATDAVRIPSGSTAERPATPAKGYLRYNETTENLEYGTGDRWLAATPFKLKIDKVTTNGYNGIMVQGEGELYFTSGFSNAWAVYTNSITDSYVFRAGLDNFSRVLIPETSPVVDSGSIGHYALSYALLQNGNLYVWGRNQAGQGGYGFTGLIPRPVLSTTNVAKVFTTPSNGAAGTEFGKMVIQKNDGFIYVSGYNGYGQLGDGTVVNKDTFVQIPIFGQNPKSVWNIGAQYGTLFVQRADGRLFACGANYHGQLGTGNTTSPISTPVDVTANWLNNDTSYEVKYIGAGCAYYITSLQTDSTTLLFADNGTTSLVKTSGFNSNRQLGDGTNVNKSTPVTLSFPARVRQAMFSGVLSGYVLLENNNLYAWGYNGYGQLGTTPANLTVPTIVQNNVSYIANQSWDSPSYGYYASMFIVKTDGYLYATGHNASGQLGVGFQQTAVTGFTRCLVPDGPGNRIKSVSQFATTASGNIILAVREDNEIFGWGYNGHSGVDVSGNTANYLAAKNFKIRRV